jgi:ABC-type transporter Mla maintaining outer membrane lipid asymmetry ATPase subunit MlaF
VEQFVHMALENTDRAYVLTKGEVVLDGRSSDLLGSDELLASYLGGEVDPAGVHAEPASPVPAAANGPSNRRRRRSTNV